MEARLQAVRSLWFLAADAAYIGMHTFFLWFVERFNEVHEVSIGILYIDHTSLNNDALFFTLKFNQLQRVFSLNLSKLLRV